MLHPGQMPLMCIEVTSLNTFGTLHSTFCYPERHTERKVWSPQGDLYGLLGTGFIPELELEAAGRPPTLTGLEGSSSLSCLPAFTTQTASPNRCPLSIGPVAWVPSNRAVVLPGKQGVILRLTHFMDHSNFEKLALSFYTFYFLVSLSSHTTFALLLPVRGKVQRPLFLVRRQ